MLEDLNIKDVLNNFRPVSLKELDSVSLMVRKDRKYLFEVSKLVTVLESVKDQYFILEIDGVRDQLYTTTYFDTPALDLYLMHHRGKLNREKIRLRRYNSDGASFLEIKRKTNFGFTNKSRVPVDTEAGLVLNEEESFLKKLTTYNGYELITSLNNEFHRITLVNFESKERVTLDFGVRLKKPEGENWIHLNGICIAEIKRSGSFYRSPFAKCLKENRIYPMRFSKYCYGIARLFTNVPINRFKEKFLKVDKLNKLSFSKTS